MNNEGFLVSIFSILEGNIFRRPEIENKHFIIGSFHFFKYTQNETFNFPIKIVNSQSKKRVEDVR